VSGCKWEAALTEAVDRRAKAIVGLLQSLIAIPTVTDDGPQGPYLEMAISLGERLRKAGLETCLAGTSDTKLNTVGWRTFGAAERASRAVPGLPQVHVVPSVLFLSHVDVLPTERSAWSHDPFKGEVDGGMIYGLGSCDMKAGLAASVAAAEILSEVTPDLAKLGFLPEGKVTVAATVDEESGGADGIGFLADRRADLLRADYAVVPEPSTLNHIWVGAKGALFLDIDIRGRATHSGRPWLGANPITMAFELMRRLEGLAAADDHDYPILRHLGPGAGRTHFNVSRIRAGLKDNLIPPTCNLGVSYRMSPGRDTALYLSQVETVIREMSEADPTFEATVTPLVRAEPSEVASDSPVVTRLREAAGAVAGLTPAPGALLGFSDMRFLIATGLCPQTCHYGPGALEPIGSPDEAVAVSELIAFTKIYALFAARVLHQGEPEAV